ncbi:uncharacterized protein LY89DRAFT_690085 [Mollisia scopiformis]|uniref:Uncharacterized protein n=1 Tax=Mollisia scopiformis TaxID=149040 RepID=A0A132BB28_MOLSC|nr:uncharacterized protein LY89DRAFT_690085 [Mollisia scopiformis]KUJ09622.1 hypothetical protein LY89DRAFT_690085 [Mollisia scopiformis]
MSAEVVKKRGRPKKVISDPVEVELPDLKKKSTTRAKSTKAVPKPAKVPTTTAAKTVQPKKSVSSSSGTPATSKTSSQPTAPSKLAKAVSEQPESKRAAAPVENPTIKAEPPTSKILEQVRELEAKKSTTQQPSQPSMPAKAVSKTVAAAKSTPPSNTPSTNTKPAAEVKAPTSNPLSKKPAASPPPPPPKPTSKPHIPIAALNSEIVSNISTRAGARPNTSGSKDLPKNYQSVARKVRNTIVALPILIGTSYILYQRFVLGEEQKQLIPVQPKESPELQEVEVGKVKPPSASTASS